ncbi:protein CHUP1, chloroplastic [Humulus lupulus]|uniref:protein CHUP1, chloroplastic n=1 Tax=Humulus lupulus TaxID=3486 RepID=UPI002B41146A|nr:protein CHUP1, chloroplastic [Humulus lupulus]
MKPLIFKAGIPLALSVAAFVYARIVARRSVFKDTMLENTKVNSLEIGSQFGSEKSFHSLSSTRLPSVECNEPLVIETNSMESSETQNKPDLEEEILGLKSRLDDLRNIEEELEMKFIRYNNMKEQESVLMHLTNMLLLEMAQIEFLDRETSLIEDESRRLEKLLVESLRLLEQLEYWKSENGLLQRKVKRLLRIKKVQSSLIKEKELKIKARERELLKTQEELETRTSLIKELEDEVRELRMVLHQMQEDKNELMQKLVLEETFTSSLSKIAENKGVLSELEQLKKDRATEVEEIIYLRWSNACLRHELMKNQTQYQDKNQNKYQWELDIQGNLEMGNSGLEQELASMVLGHSENGFGEQASTCSKRKKLVQKLKKWVEGSEKGKRKLDEKVRHEIKCFGRHSVSDDKEEHLQGRRSCSSA